MQSLNHWATREAPSWDSYRCKKCECFLNGKMTCGMNQDKTVATPVRIRSSFAAFRYLSFLSPAVGFPNGASGKEHACQCRRHKRHGFDPRIGKVPWRRKWQPTLVFLLENPTDRGAWRAMVHRVAESQARLKQLSAHTHTHSTSPTSVVHLLPADNHYFCLSLNTDPNLPAAPPSHQV